MSSQRPTAKQATSSQTPLSRIVGFGRWLFTNDVIAGFSGVLGIISIFFPGEPGSLLGWLLVVLAALVIGHSWLPAWLMTTGRQGRARLVEQILSLTTTLVTALTVLFVGNWLWHVYNEEPLTNRPLRVHAWGIRGASGTFTVDSDGSGPFYRLGYTLPVTDTYAGLSFTFNEPERLARFSALRVGISFEGENPLCAVFLKREETPDDERKPAQAYFDLEPDRRYSDASVGLVTRNGVDYVTIPLQLLTADPNLDEFREVGFQTGGANTGEGSCRIHEVTLVR